MEILKNFGIQPVLLAAQIVNFLIIFLLLKRLFYQPITQALRDRQKRIEESLKNADLVEERLRQTEEKTAQILEEAKTTAQTIVSDASQEAARIMEKANLEARKATELEIIKAKAQIEKEKAVMEQQLEKETLNLVLAVVKKVLGRSLGTRERQDLTAKATSEITREMK